jgi:hypothetical protein
VNIQRISKQNKQQKLKAKQTPRGEPLTLIIGKKEIRRGHKAKAQLGGKHDKMILINRNAKTPTCQVLFHQMSWESM